ncbi:glycosyltransferase family 2 protein [Pontibacter sp. G13]|uniref:glycosyltransferase n=1 Tax=Pontibacter sp. G13 TaxID=3074898 RepID=UPI00288C3594|nr:glycosyltransferase family 2 protein [Pontibacter sp. G13]WNJ18196.1 glycosyltransferase family 2 protein [Pontibacter sp. G13]
MEELFYFVFGFLVIRFMVSGYNFFCRANIPHHPLPEDRPKISILIPARNEAENLPHLFHILRSLARADREIIILDDGSEDETARMLEAQLSRIPGFRWIQGGRLPEGWLGKNYACHQLALAAKGEYFLFLDADIQQVDSAFIDRAVHEMQTRELDCLSVFPDQIMESPGEQMVVPLMHYLLLSMLPLPWVMRSPFVTMSAANGQFMLFQAASYRSYLWHARVKSEIVEDIKIMQTVKRLKRRGMTYLSEGEIQTRMYPGYWQAVQGFSKNLFAGFNNSFVGILVYLFAAYGAWGWLVWELPTTKLCASSALILGIRMWISLSARQSIWRNWMLHPIQMASIILISLVSLYKWITGKNEWKGRNVQLRRVSY